MAAYGNQFGPVEAALYINPRIDASKSRPFVFFWNSGYTYMSTPFYSFLRMFLLHALLFNADWRKSLDPVSIIRPTSSQLNAAVAAVNGFIKDGLFFDPATNSNTGIVAELMSLAQAADAARRT